MIRKLMLSCRAATALMEKKQRQDITRSERIRLAMHLALCAACRHYERQSAFMEKLFRNKRPAIDEEEVEQSASELEKKILKQLDKDQ